MKIQISLLISTLMLVILYVFKVLSNKKMFYDDLTIDQVKENVPVVYAFAIPISLMFCIFTSYRDFIIKYVNADVFDILLVIGGYVITIFLLTKQVGANGYAENISDMSGSVFFISVIISSVTYLVLCFLSGLLLFVKYQFIDEGNNNEALELLIKITVTIVEIILWTLVTDLIIEKIFIFNVSGKIVYLATLLLISEMIIPSINTFISQKIYGKFKKQD